MPKAICVPAALNHYFSIYIDCIVVLYRTCKCDTIHKAVYSNSSFIVHFMYLYGHGGNNCSLKAINSLIGPWSLAK